MYVNTYIDLIVVETSYVRKCEDYNFKLIGIVKNILV